MFIPYKRNIVFEKTYQFKRFIPGGVSVSIEKGSKVKEDTVLANGSAFGESLSIDVARELGIKQQETRKFIECLHGERIFENDTLAKKKSRVMGKEKVIYSPISGVVNLDYIDSGIIKILSAASETIIYAGTEGKVVSVIRDRHVVISTSALLVSAKHIFGESVQGELLFLNSENREQIEQDFSGSIIVPDFQVDLEYLRSLAIAGAKGVILGGLDSSFKNELTPEGLWGMTIFITEGFGDIQINNVLSKLLAKNDGRISFIDSSGERIILTNTTGYEKRFEKQPFFKDISIGDEVQIFHSEYFHFYGIVDELEDDFVTVRIYRWGQERRVKLPIYNIISL